MKGQKYKWKILGETFFKKSILKNWKQNLKYLGEV